MEDKNKVLEATLAQIEKQFGKGSIMRLGDSTHMNVEAISTGSISLDMATGIGGIPKGRITEIYGPESSGKCLTEDSYILTTTGYKTIKDIFNENGLETKCIYSEVPVKYPLINMNGEVENTTHFTYNARRKIKKISTNEGTIIKCTYKHPLRVLNKNGFLIWKQAENLEPGDILVGRIGANCFGKHNIPFAYMMGAFVADAHFDDIRIMFTNDDPDVISRVLEEAKTGIGDITPRRYKNNDKGSFGYYFTSKELVLKFYEKFNITAGVAKDKTVPPLIFSADRKTQIEFLRGYFDCESYSNTGSTGNVEVVSASYELLHKVRLMLSNLGIHSTLKLKKVEAYPQNDYWKLFITGSDALAYIEIVGTHSSKIAARFEKLKKIKRIPRRIPHITPIVDAYYKNIEFSERSRASNYLIYDIQTKGTKINWKSLKKLLEYQTDTNSLGEYLDFFANSNIVFETIADVEVLSGVPTFDFAMEQTHSFICEGIINHNTSVALHVISEVQKTGGKAAFIDAEHALDPIYAGNLGVNVEELLISQPDTGEQALEICDMLVRSSAVDIVVVDSVAALVPKAEINGEMGDSHVGLQARLMSQALRKLTGAIHKSNTAVIFINQLREKVGVMFGCLHADTVIPFTDGASYTIREIVDNKIEGSVWSYDEKTGKIVEGEIIGWHHNGEVNKASDYIHIETASIDAGGGAFGITVTPDHLIMTEKGWKKAKDITIADKLLSQYESIVNGTLADFLYGTFCGDSHISVRNRATANMRLQDNKNPEYVEWKIEKLKPFFSFKQKVSHRERGAVKYESTPSSELAVIKKSLGERDPIVLLRDHYSDLGLALWYMDDGHFDSANSHCRATISVKRFSENVEKLAEILSELARHGLEATLDDRGTFRFNKENTLKLFDKIYKYVPECMQYKLDNSHKNKYEDFTLESISKRKKYFVPVEEIRVASQRQMRQRGKYDLTIAEHHNYIAGNVSNGVVVHNSPETTCGGKSLKFYASMRMDIRRIKTLKDGEEFTGNLTRAKIVKNKVAPPFKTAEFEIEYGKGISKEGDILDCAVEAGLVDKKGAWYSYDGEKIGQGRERAKDFLKENPETAEKLRNLLVQSVVKVDNMLVDENGEVIE